MHPDPYYIPPETPRVERYWTLRRIVYGVLILMILLSLLLTTVLYGWLRPPSQSSAPPTLTPPIQAVELMTETGI